MIHRIIFDKAKSHAIVYSSRFAKHGKKLHGSLEGKFMKSIYEGEIDKIDLKVNWVHEIMSLHSK